MMFFAMMTLAATAQAARSEARTVGLKTGFTCAYAPRAIGDPSLDDGTVVDIDELDDRAGRVVGFVSTTSKGHRYLQGTTLMSLASAARLRLRFSTGPVSEMVPFVGDSAALTVRPCRSAFVMPGDRPGQEQRLIAANYSGFDVLPKGRETYYLDRLNDQYRPTASSAP